MDIPYHLPVAPLAVAACEPALVSFVSGSTARIVTYCVHVQDDDSHAGALLLYSQLAQDRGEMPTVLHVLLKVIVAMPTHKTARKFLADLLGASGGIDLLHRQLEPSAEGASAAYAFLAVIVKVWSRCMLFLCCELGDAQMGCVILFPPAVSSMGMFVGGAPRASSRCLGSLLLFIALPPPLPRSLGIPLAGPRLHRHIDSPL